MRIVAIDYGIVRIGIAITDERGVVALPFGTVIAEKTFEKTAEKIKQELSVHLPHIQMIVLGLPLLLSGKEGDMAHLVKEFGTVLEKTLGIEVSYWDERLSSSIAHSAMKEMGMKRKKRSKIVDPIAATLILQSYLEAHKVS